MATNCASLIEDIKFYTQKVQDAINNSSNTLVLRGEAVDEAALARLTTNQLDNLQYNATNQRLSIEAADTALRNAIAAADKAGCTIPTEDKNKASTILQRGLVRRTTLRTLATLSIAEMEKQAEATEQANTNLNNSGTGKPGTAGQGVNSTVGKTPANANELNEVEVTGTRKVIIDPETGLEEVTVTAPRRNDQLELTEPNLLSPKIDVDSLRPTTPDLTGEDLDELEEVTIQSKKVNTNQGAVQETREQATLKDETNFEAKKDWRVRLSLSPGATYLYRDDSNKLLAPLQSTDGILFPYTPSINVQYAANYGAVRPAHSNYAFYQYENSSIDSVSITCDFTAQDTYEGAYLLAVIHFLRSCTKMFYGQDQNPKPGTPPPLVYLFGFGDFQFNAHPLVITGFNYSLPADVDYLRVGELGTFGSAPPGSGLEEVTVTAKKPLKFNWGTLAQNFIQSRLSTGAAAIGNLIGLQLSPGGGLSNPTGFTPYSAAASVSTPTYVPTRIQISITAAPVMSRFEISQNFSLKDYANGTLLKGVSRKGAAFW